MSKDALAARKSALKEAMKRENVEVLVQHKVDHLLDVQRRTELVAVELVYTIGVRSRTVVRIFDNRAVS